MASPSRSSSASVTPGQTPSPTPPLMPAPKGLAKRKSFQHVYEVTHNVKMHPDFRDSGDVLLVCRENGREHGFRVHSDVLLASSGRFVLELARPPTLGTHVIMSPDSVEELHTVLRFLYLGHPAHAPFAPSVREYGSLAAFVEAYEAPRALFEVLQASINRRAEELIRTIGADTNSLLKLAHRLRAEGLWRAILASAARGGPWSIVHNPWDAVPGTLPFSVWSVLLVIARVVGLGVPLADVVVVYPDDAKVRIASRDGAVSITHAFAAV